MPETDLIGRLNKRAENGRVFHADRKLFAEAATALSENIETINGQAMDLATLRARLASCEAHRDELLNAGRKVLDGLNARIDFTPRDAVPVFHGIVDLHDAVNRAAFTTGGEDA